MGHVKQKKSTSSSTSTPPEVMTIEVVNHKEKVPHTAREHHRRSYPEQLNAEELISQINCRSSLNVNEITNDSNNNANSNNNTTHRTSNQLTQVDVENVDVDGDVENGPMQRHHRQRPLYRRLISFIRNLWIGAKFNVGKDGKQFT